MLLFFSYLDVQFHISLVVFTRLIGCRFHPLTFFCATKLMINFLNKNCRFPFTMLVLQKSVKMVWSLPEVVWVVYTFTVMMLCWLLLWSFGVAGIVALSIDVNGRWWLLVVSWQVLNIYIFFCVVILSTFCIKCQKMCYQVLTSLTVQF